MSDLTEQPTVRLGLIGLGRIGAFHAETLTHLDCVEELFVTDAVPEAAAALAERFPVTVVPSAEELLNRDVDGVVIASSTPTHLALIRSAVEAKLPTFCEKPVAQDPHAAAQLAPWIEASGVPVQIGFPRRFDPAFVRAKAELDSGALGWLTTVRSTTMDPVPPPAAYIAASGGIFHDCSIHDLDAVRWVTGREVAEVYAAGSNRGDACIRDANDVDTASILLTLDDGTLGVVSNTRYNGRGYDVRLELHGSLDAIAAGLDERLPIRSAEPSTTFPSGTPHRFFIDRFAEAFRAELAAFADVVTGSRPSPCTFADGVQASLVAEACTTSWREHRPVRLAKAQ
jgi:myo-inositol 2-dehydrogenase / D-chiro-inositol 1-dehydrogenase